MSGPVGSSQWMYAGGYKITNSLRFNDASAAHMTMTPGAAGNRRLWTWSAWVKQSTPANGSSGLGMFGSYTNNNNTANIQIDGTSGNFHFEDYTGSYNALQVTERVLLDYNAWYHLMVVLDTAQSTAANRVKMYINGALAVTKTGGAHALPDQDAELRIANNAQHEIGLVNGAYHFDGYMADINFVDGAALTPASFAETGKYGEWKPIDTSGLTFGDEGFHLDFKLPTANATNLGKDTSGNSNNFALANITATDQMLDTPTNNFALFNPLVPSYNATSSVEAFSEGNTRILNSGSGVTGGGYSNMDPGSSGKWYFEALLVDVGNNAGIGVTTDRRRIERGTPSFSAYDGGVIYLSGGNKNLVGTASSYGNSYTDGDIIGVAFSIDDDTIEFFKNNASEGSLALYTNDQSAYHKSGYWPSVAIDPGNGEWRINFGQDSSFAAAKTAGSKADGNGRGDFFYTPPSGYLAMCTENLPEPTVVPSEQFKTVLYTGDGADDRDIQVGFRPGWSWFKQRGGTTNHYVYDIMRGGTKYLIPNLANADATDADGVDTGKTNAQIGGGGGFRLLGNSAPTNGDGLLYVSWNWRASESGGVSNSNGTIASSVNVNPVSGFSIVTWTGTAEIGTVGHGLSIVPRLILMKNRSAGSTDWQIFTFRMTSLNEMNLNQNHASTATDVFNDTDPTTSVFSINASAVVNGDGNAMIAYCFHDVLGFSKFDSYEGNNNANGRFVHTGFRPALIWIKAIDATGDWYLYDNKRLGFNVDNNYLRTNQTSAESTDDILDIVSNGFKLRSTNSEHNAAATFDYIAFAETPFKYANGR